MPEKKESPWKATATPNLVRYEPAGTYYLRGRFGGNPVRESLGTDNYKIAKLKLGERLATLRAGRPAGLESVRTIADALAIIRAQVANDPALKASSRATYFDWLDDLRPPTDKTPRPATAPTEPLQKLSNASMEEWWFRTAKKFSPARANQLFMLMRRAVKVARKAGAMNRDPMEDLKRMDVPPTEWNMVTVEQFQVIVSAVRARSSEAADWVEFMTYCGLRPGEVEALLWQHIDDSAGVIRVHGGEEGPKNRRKRPVPIVPAMAELLARMRDGQSRVGKLFKIKRPKATFQKALDRLGMPHMRIYDLRHMFATVCNASGVDAKTFSMWLGHRDGGALALRRYVHPTEEHERLSAAKVKF